MTSLVLFRHLLQSLAGLTFIVTAGLTWLSFYLPLMGAQAICFGVLTVALWVGASYL